VRQAVQKYELADDHYRTKDTDGPFEKPNADGTAWLAREQAYEESRDACEGWVRSLLAASAQPGAGSHLTSVATTSGSSPLGVATAQPAEDGTRVAARFVLRGLREALSSASEYADGLADHIERGAAPAQPARTQTLSSAAYRDRRRSGNLKSQAP
jgi:hypothetical protein